MWKTCSSKFFESIKFQGESTRAKEFFNSLKVWSVWKKALCVIESVKFQMGQREFFALLQVSSLCKFASDRTFFFPFKFTWVVKDFFQSFQSFERMFVVAFMFKMSSFQMESLKVMERFYGGNFHLWKFKMHMMLSKHGFWKNLLMGVPLCQVKKLQRPITMKKRPRLLHCFVNISRMPNLHTFNIVIMWEVRGRFFVYWK